MKKNFDYSKTKEIKIVIGGKEIVGYYFVEKGILTVIYDMQEKSTQVGDMVPEQLAKILLREFFEKNL